MEALCNPPEIKNVMKLNDRIALMSQLGSRLLEGSDGLNNAIIKATQYNPWFTKESIDHGLHALANNYLNFDALQEWTSQYRVEDSAGKKIGLILAGNIPMVGFHDILSVFLSGNVAKIKLSSKDEVLLKFIIDELNLIEPGIAPYFEIVDKLNNIDALIATGSNSTGSYFEKYFGHVPHIIRKNRHAVAIVKNDTSTDALSELGKDIFTYFGLGCRNVSKLYLEEGFDLQKIFDAILPYSSVIDHHKYKNNYDYNNALYLLNQEEFLTNNFLIVKESTDISSRIASLHYEYFDSEESLMKNLEVNKDLIQCVVSDEPIGQFSNITFGAAQFPRLDDYADGVDTMEFLTQLNE